MVNEREIEIEGDVESSRAQPESERFMRKEEANYLSNIMIEYE